MRRTAVPLAVLLVGAALTTLPAAAASAAPTTVPQLSAPAPGAELPVAVTVTATTSAAKVKFTLAGALAWRAVAVSATGGVATANIETYGMDGAVTLTAQDCAADLSCNATGDTVEGLSVVNPPIV